MGAYYGLGLGLGGAPVPIRGSHLAVGGLIEQYPGAAAAYSLRALRNNTGNVVRVRRSSDDTEQDFTAAQVSDGTLVDFVNNGTSDLYGERMWFDGVDDEITDTGSPIADVGSIEIQFVFTDIEGVVFFSQQNGSLIYGVSITQSRTAGNVHIVFHKGGSTFENISQSGFTAGDVIVAKANYDFITNTFSVDINGLSGDGALPGRHSGTIAINIFKIGSNGNDTFFNTGLIWNLREYAADQSTVIRYWRGTGNTNADWTDQIGSNNGTVNGSPALYTGQGFDGFVTKWYGQVPGVNSSNSTSTSQPKIVNNGSLITGNSVGMPLWDGSNDTLRVVASEMPTPTTAFQISAVCKNNKSALSGNEYIFGQYESATNNRSFALVYRPTSRIGVNFGNPSTGAFAGSWSSDNVTLIGELLAVGVTYNAGTVKIYVNGSEVSSSILYGSIPTSLFNTSSDYTIGSNSPDSPVAVFDGQIGEIYFAKNLTDDIVKIQQNQMEGWGITP